MRLTACQRGLRILCHGVASLALVAGVWLWVVAGGRGTWVLDLRGQGVGVYVRDGAVACAIGKFEPRDNTLRAAAADSTDHHVGQCSAASMASEDSPVHVCRGLQLTHETTNEMVRWLAIASAVGTLHRDGYGVFAWRSYGDLHVVAVTRWSVVPVMLLAALPSLRLLRADMRQRARVQTGRCLACGYCLTGNQSGVCPECGATTPGTPAGSR